MLPAKCETDDDFSMNKCSPTTVKKFMPFVLFFAASSDLRAEVEFGSEVIANYAKYSQALQIDGKTATFKTGGAGLKLKVKHPLWGRFFVSAGGGYSPSEQASFLSVTLKGSADGTFYGFGYQKDIRLSSVWTAELAADYVAYDLAGDLSGVFGDTPVNAKVTTDTTLREVSLGLRYALSEEVSLAFGYGSSDWSLDAVAEGSLGAISATTEAIADGRDPFQYLSVQFMVRRFPVSLRFQRSKLSVDNQVDLNSLDIHLSLPNDLWF